jgi:hypothetical protein
MLIFPQMLVAAANEASIKVPEDLENYDKNEFPHWFILCATQLARPMRPGEHWENAKIISNLTFEQLSTMSYDDFAAIGVI